MLLNLRRAFNLLEKVKFKKGEKVPYNQSRPGTLRSARNMI